MPCRTEDCSNTRRLLPWPKVQVWRLVQAPWCQCSSFWIEPATKPAHAVHRSVSSPLGSMLLRRGEGCFDMP